METCSEIPKGNRYNGEMCGYSDGKYVEWRNLYNGEVFGNIKGKYR